MADTRAGGFEVDGFEQVRDVRAHVAEELTAFGYGPLVDDAQLVVSELVTNALLHGGGRGEVRLRRIDDGVRAEVVDRSHNLPVVAVIGDRTLTGRGLHLVTRVSRQWGVEPLESGKIVWAEIAPGADRPDAMSEEELLAAWSDDAGWGDADVAEDRVHITLGDVPTDLLLDAKSHVDNLVREFSLAAAGAASGQTAKLPPALARVVEAIVGRFSEARLMIKRQAVAAARSGQATTRLELDLPVSAAAAGEEYVLAMDEADAYCRAARLLTLETPPQHRVFRRWYVGELVAQLRAAEAGVDYAPVSFQQRLLVEVDRVAEAQRASERAARLYTVAGALASAATPEAVAEAVLTEGAAALGASGGGLILAAKEGRLVVPGTVGYGEELVERLRDESPDAELPAAVALRTGQAVWLESRDERDARFPELVGLERTTVSLCAVPLVASGQLIGALRLSFTEARLFDEDERRFVQALAAQCAQALERAQLQQERLDISRRLQRSLLPPQLPVVPGLDVAAVYHPLGRGVEIGGDLYDVWSLADDRFAIAVGDVAGNGPEAAAVTALVRHTLRAVTMTETDPVRVLQRLNTAMSAAALSPETETFCTVVFGVGQVDERAILQVASGGHPHPLLRRRDGTVETVTIGGNLIGLLDEIEVSSREVVLERGDTLVLFTDGVVDARARGAFFEVEGIVEVLRAEHATAADTAVALEQAVLRHKGGQLEDDMAVLVLRVPT
jgi:serine phosphatase RsbU (regulator of sigma subunit)/anti-sigma regulatory factor (Ser/Thr protein kinase)